MIRCGGNASIGGGNVNMSGGNEYDGGRLA
jgi:hypothetical protein